jgi:hypothetical protein
VTSPASSPAMRDASSPPQGAGTQLFNFGRHLGGGKGELTTHRRRDVDHLNAPPLETDLFQELAHVFDSSTGVDITILVMTVALQSTGHHHAVGAVLKGVEDVQHVHPARAR